MYFKRVRIKDFGPIRDIELEFEQDKVYHFIGENDSGKSMILDAMNILCNNIAGLHVKKYVSDYAENFFIEGEDFEGNIIQLQRGEVSFYKLILPDGTEKFYDKIGGGVPVSIQNIVNVYVDELKNEKFNFRYSDDKILFMNTTPGENYSFFQKALRTDKVLNALKKANTIQNGLEKDIEITQSKITFEKEKLDNSPDITYIQEELDTYRKSIQATMRKAKLLNEIVIENKKLESLDKINIPTEIMEFNAIEGRKKLAIVTKSKELLIGSATGKKLDSIVAAGNDLKKGYEEVIKIKKVLKLINELTQLNSKENLLNSIAEKGNLVKEESVNISSDLTELKVIKNKQKLIEEQKLLEEKVQIVEQLYTKLIDINNLKSTYVEKINTRKIVSELQNNLDKLRTQTESVNNNKVLIEHLDNKRTQFLRENNFCPVVVNSVNKRCPFSNKTLDELVGEA